MDPVFVVDVGSASLKYGTVFRKVRKGTDSRLPATPNVAWSATRQRHLHDASWQDRTSLDVGSVTQQLARILADPETRINASEYTIVLLVDPLTSARDKQLLLRAAFEELAARRALIGFAPVTALLSTGMSSGVVVDVGHRAAVVTPVHGSVPVFTGVERIPRSGAAAVDDEIANMLLLRQANTRHTTDSEEETEMTSPPVVPAGASRALLERVVDSYLHTLKRTAITSPSASLVMPRWESPLQLPLPDGSTLEFSCPSVTAKDVQDCARMVLGPVLDTTGAEGPVTAAGVSVQRQPLRSAAAVAPRLLYCAQRALQCIQKRVIGVIAATPGFTGVVSHVPLSMSAQWTLVGGGASLAPGLEAYLTDGLSNIPTTLCSTAPLFQAPRDPFSAAWTGGTMLTQISVFADMCISKDTYDEFGPRESLRFTMSDSR